MKALNLTLLPFLILLSCTQTDLSKKAAQAIAQADRDMSAMAQTEGFHKALLAYADENVVKPQEGELPVLGKNKLMEAWSKSIDFTTISWMPTKWEAGASGDFGYSLGNWKMTTPDTIYYGNYCTIWKKQTDGSWKFVYDGGNNTPKPE